MARLGRRQLAPQFLHQHLASGVNTAIPIIGKGVEHNATFEERKFDVRRKSRIVQLQQFLAGGANKVAINRILQVQDHKLYWELQRRPRQPQYLNQFLANGQNPVQPPPPPIRSVQAHRIIQDIKGRPPQYLNQFLANGSNPVVPTQKIYLIRKPIHGDLRRDPRQYLPRQPQYLDQLLANGINSGIIGGMSAGQLRTMNLIDVFASLNQDVENALSPTLNVDESFTLFGAVTETAKMVDAATAAALTVPTWGTGSWGVAKWST